MTDSFSKKPALVLFALLLMMLVSCSDRARLNPLDPNNPYSQGAPTGVRLFSQRNTVTLLWSPMPVNDLEHYIIYRSAEQGGLARYDSIPANVTQYTDNNVTYDKQYTYAIQAQTKYDESRLSETLSIVPGAYDIVVADYYSQRLIKITYDGNRMFEFYDGYTPTDLAIFDHRIYFTNLWDNSLKYIDQSGDVHSFSLGEAPVDFAFDRNNRFIYILARDNNSLFILSVDGEFRGKVTLDADIHFYSACSYDPVLDCLWITDESFHKIYRFDPASDALTLIAENIRGPEEFIIDSANGGGWIASLNGIIHVRSDNSVERLLPNHYIYDISRDESSGLLYYSGYSTENNSWEIGYVSETTYTVLHTSYAYIYKIKIVPETIGTGLALIDGYNAEIIRLNARGQEIGRRAGIYGVTGIELR
ncbi:hypothetical protein EH223_01725 [candidate division KSB1 bacterium]|nr:hypothetical protein [candidate division KSB1 bacterium]RQW06916.1 MAG: hypothetical protein EH223_01725 [candidate division KSB1 bacterium]